MGHSPCILLTEEKTVKIVRVQTLWSEFDNFKMKEIESFEDYQNRVNGDTIDDQKIVVMILRSLTRKFEFIVVGFEGSNARISTIL